GGAGIPKGPKPVAFGVDLLGAAELAEESEKAAMTEQLGEHAIVEPALAPLEAPAEPHRQDDRADQEELAGNDDGFCSEHSVRGRIGIVMDENAGQRGEDRKRRKEIADHISAAIEMGEMPRERIRPDVTRQQHACDALAE